MKKQTGFIDSDAITTFIVILVVLGVAGGIAVSFGLPWLWNLIKPFLHQVTA